MFKRLLLGLISYCFVSSPVFADNQVVQQCPDITIESLFPLKVKVTVPPGANPDTVAKQWKIVTHEIDKSGTNALPARNDLPRTEIYSVLVPRSEIDAVTQHYVTELPLFDKKIAPKDSDVVPYELQVLTGYVDNINRAAAVPLRSCQYGLYWKKYNKQLYYKDTISSSSDGVHLSATTKEKLKRFGAPIANGLKSAFFCVITDWICMEKYYYLYNALIELTPTTPISISVPSLLDNDTGWQYNNDRTQFHCSHERWNDAKCNWGKP